MSLLHVFQEASGGDETATEAVLACDVERTDVFYSIFVEIFEFFSEFLCLFVFCFESCWKRQIRWKMQMLMV